MNTYVYQYYNFHRRHLQTHAHKYHISNDDKLEFCYFDAFIILPDSRCTLLCIGSASVSMRWNRCLDLCCMHSLETRNGIKGEKRGSSQRKRRVAMKINRIAIKFFNSKTDFFNRKSVAFSRKTDKKLYSIVVYHSNK